MLHHVCILVKKKTNSKYTRDYLNLYSSYPKAQEVHIDQQWSLTNAKT